MKKTSKVFGAVLCSAALAMGMAMPAFAEKPNDIDINESTDINTSADSTTQDVDVRLVGFDSTTQIQCTMPIDLTVAAPTAGGLLSAPTKEAYTIKNNSADLDLKIAKVKAKPATGFTLQKNPWLDSKGVQLESVATVPSARSIYMTIAKGNDNGVSIGQGITGSNGALVGNGTATAPEVTLDWQLPKNSSIGIQIAGHAKPADTGSDSFTATSVPAVTLTYTVSK